MVVSRQHYIREICRRYDSKHTLEAHLQADKVLKTLHTVMEYKVAT